MYLFFRLMKSCVLRGSWRFTVNVYTLYPLVWMEHMGCTHGKYTCRKSFSNFICSIQQKSNHWIALGAACLEIVTYRWKKTLGSSSCTKNLTSPPPLPIKMTWVLYSPLHHCWKLQERSTDKSSLLSKWLVLFYKFHLGFLYLFNSHTTTTNWLKLNPESVFQVLESGSWDDSLFWAVPNPSGRSRSASWGCSWTQQCHWRSRWPHWLGECLFPCLAGLPATDTLGQRWLGYGTPNSGKQPEGIIAMHAALCCSWKWLRNVI